MTLDEYFENTGECKINFANKADICLSSVYRYIHGSKCNLKIAEKISSATNGKVSIKEILRTKSLIQKNTSN